MQNPNKDPGFPDQGPMLVGALKVPRNQLRKEKTIVMTLTAAAVAVDMRDAVLAIMVALATSKLLK